MQLLAPAVTLAKGLQHNLIPVHKRNQKKLRSTLAFTCTRIISHCTQYKKSESIVNKVVKELGARVGVLAMPLIVSASAFQLGGLFICHITSMVLSWEWDCTVLSEDLIQTAFMIIDIFAQIIIGPIGLITPKLYQLPPFVPIKNVQTLEIKSLNQKIHVLQTIPIPTISAKSPVSYPELGITTHLYDNQQQSFELSGKTDTKYDVKDIDDFVCPNGTVELTIDCTKQTDFQNIVRILNGPHQIHRLVLISPEKIGFFENIKLITTSHVWSIIHTLVIRNCHNISEAQVNILVENVQHIACLDLRSCCAIAHNHLSTLSEKCLVFPPKSTRPHVTFSLPITIKERLDQLNTSISNACKELEKATPAQSHQKTIQTMFLSHSSIATFIPQITFLKDKESIPRWMIEDIIKQIVQNCKMMSLLNLSKTQISLEALALLREALEKQKLTNLKTLNLSSCPHEIINTIRKPETQIPPHYMKTIKHKEKEYLQKPYRFAQDLLSLFAHGVSTIQLDNVKGLEEIIEEGVNDVLRRTDSSACIVYFRNNKNVRFPELNYPHSVSG